MPLAPPVCRNSDTSFWLHWQIQWHAALRFEPYEVLEWTPSRHKSCREKNKESFP